MNVPQSHEANLRVTKAGKNEDLLNTLSFRVFLFFQSKVLIRYLQEIKYLQFFNSFR